LTVYFNESQTKWAPIAWNDASSRRTIQRGPRGRRLSGGRRFAFHHSQWQLRVVYEKNGDCEVQHDVVASRSYPTFAAPWFTRVVVRLSFTSHVDTRCEGPRPGTWHRIRLPAAMTKKLSWQCAEAIGAEQFHSLLQLLAAEAQPCQGVGPADAYYMIDLSEKYITVALGAEARVFSSACSAFRFGPPQTMRCMECATAANTLAVNVRHHRDELESAALPTPRRSGRASLGAAQPPPLEVGVDEKPVPAEEQDAARLKMAFQLKESVKFTKTKFELTALAVRSFQGFFFFSTSREVEGRGRKRKRKGTGRT
jgi:hypothetical protein